MIVDDKPIENPHVIVTAPTETLTCSICGRTYPSRGKNDSGICRECERDLVVREAPLVGGPLGK